MGNRVFVLSDKTINQIAAGEVIEDPSSVIKELTENAIDAEATSIQIEIMGGGHFKICVRDNGVGMSQDDAFLAFERHATSKIKEVNDLQKLSSMGFRGEALASIAACAKVELITCEKGADVGSSVLIHGGKMFKQEAVSRDHGTTIEVASLFYNVPARKAFQKSKGQSTNDVVKMVSKLALAHPSIAIELISHGETLMKTSGDLDLVVKDVLGTSFSSEMKKISFEMNGLSLHGMISTPLNTRKNRTGQYLFINQRPIYSPLISKCVSEAYGTRLSTREYPLFVLWIDIPPHLVDVNVHPQKSEVRFKNEEMIASFISAAISNAFGQASSIESLTLPKANTTAPPAYTPAKLQEPTLNYQVSLTTTIEKKRTFSVMGTFEHFAIVQFEKGSTLFGEDECEQSIGFFDMANVSKRLLFDRIVGTLQKQKEFEKQQLLFTETLEFSPAEAREIKSNLPFLNRIGIGIREFGEKDFIVEALADHIDMEHVRDLVLEVSEKLSHEELAKKLIVACRGKKAYLHHEIINMIENVMKSSDPVYSPSGKQMCKIFSPEEFGGWLER